MGSLRTSSETAFTVAAEVLYDFVTDPTNWPKTYPGSTGIVGVERTPLRVGDTWSETGLLGDLEVRFTWRLITAVRPTRFVFQSIGRIAQEPDGAGGYEGMTTIAYDFSRPGAGVTLFHRSMTTEVPKHGRLPAQVVLSHEPFAIDAYHDAVGAAVGAAPHG